MAPTTTPSRRRLLYGIGTTALAVSIAGCGGPGEEDDVNGVEDDPEEENGVEDDPEEADEEATDDPEEEDEEGA